MKLRHYETFYLLQPNLNEEERSSISEKLQTIITERKGQIVSVDPWPLQKLAYKVQKQTQGYYVLMEYGATADTISELERNLRLDEAVMKFITVKKSDSFDPEAAQKEKNESESEAAEASSESEADSGQETTSES